MDCPCFTKPMAVCNAQKMERLSPPDPILTLLEARALPEMGWLLMNLPLLSLQAAKGKEEPVLILPGFMASDRSTWALRTFLNSIGYRATGWGLGANRRPLAEYLPLLRDRMQDLGAVRNEKVNLIGWSRGGIIARELGRHHPQLVSRIITIGTPVKGGLSASSISKWIAREVGLTPEQIKRLMSQMEKDHYQTPVQVPIRAVYSRSDGIVTWKACIDDASPDVKHYEVKGSHIGMGTNVEVFRLLPKLLREAV